MKYLFILNPISGKQKDPFNTVDLIENIFDQSGHEYEFAFTSYAGEAKQISRNAVEEKFDLIVAAGGDGTINEVASGLVGTDSALGIIPLGSGNGVARSYKVPLNLKESIEFLANPKIVAIDVGKADSFYFLGVCGMGFDAVVGQKFQEFGKRGPLPYFLIGVREFLRYHPEKLLIEFNDQSISIAPLLVTISNTEQYGNGAIISPGADPRDGILEICIINPMPVHKAIKSSFKLFNKEIDTIPEYISYKTKELKIIASENGYFHTDGEPHERKRITEIKVLKKALKACSNLN
jgi:YegS/Rv2252/BmrU family lipid kinase